MLGVEWIAHRGDTFKVRVGAGENWHHLVLHTLHRRVAGLENLALIPGSVGAAPFQNIGAYGRELSELIESVEIFNLRTRQPEVLEPDGCDFGYRTSAFRTAKLTDYVITHVNIVLGQRNLRSDYVDVKHRLRRFSLHELSARRIAAAVIQIRRNKLPDWRKLGNVGSFFKNPEVSPEEYEYLHQKMDIQGFPTASGVRIPAARLIDLCGWKGRRIGAVEVWPQQPLVLVNRGATRGIQFLEAADIITASVKLQFGIDLEIEPIVLGSE